MDRVERPIVKKGKKLDQAAKMDEQLEGAVTADKVGYWTNPSVRRFAGELDPISLITDKAREVVLRAIQSGWQGPPFDPFKLATLLDIPVVSCQVV